MSHINLAKKRDRALGLFSKVVRKLVAVETAIHRAMDEAHAKRNDARAAYDLHGASINALDAELAKTEAARRSVENLLP